MNSIAAAFVSKAHSNHDANFLVALACCKTSNSSNNIAASTAAEVTTTGAHHRGLARSNQHDFFFGALRKMYLLCTSSSPKTPRVCVQSGRNQDWTDPCTPNASRRMTGIIHRARSRERASTAHRGQSEPRKAKKASKRRKRHGNFWCARALPSPRGCAPSSERLTD